MTRPCTKMAKTIGAASLMGNQESAFGPVKSDMLVEPRWR